jgi:hypothetical protein
LVGAAGWLLHINLTPPAYRPRGLSDVADLLLASRVPAVRAVVGNAGRKTLCNCLAWVRCDLLAGEWLALSEGAEFAEEHNLPARSLKEFPEQAAAANVEFVEAPPFRPERDGVTLALAVRHLAGLLPPEAEAALVRLLRQAEW